MSKKFTDLQKEVFKRLVLDTILQRLDIDESLDYINTKLKAKYDIEICPDYVKRIKTELKQDSQKELNHLRKNRLSYMNHLFFERIDEVKNMQRKLWEVIIDNQEDKPDVVIRSISELHKLSQSLSQMYEMLPFLGHLPSDAFTGVIGDNTTPTPSSAAVSSEAGVTTTPASTIGGSSGGMYRIKHDVNVNDEQSTSTTAIT
jgi:hypothetical protein